MVCMKNMLKSKTSNEFRKHYGQWQKIIYLKGRDTFISFLEILNRQAIYSEMMNILLKGSGVIIMNLYSEKITKIQGQRAGQCMF